MRVQVINKMTGVAGKLIATGVLGFCVLAGHGNAFGRQASPDHPSTAWASHGGAVLFQHEAQTEVLGVWALMSDARSAQWTELPDDFHAWQAVAMDGARILFVHSADGAWAVGGLDGPGQVATWLPLQHQDTGATAVALEGNRMLLQRGTHGPLTILTFGDEGRTVRQRTLWLDSQGWRACGMDANRILLEHERTGEVAILALNPKGYLHRPYAAFKLTDGWTVRDFSGDLVLAQEGSTGAIRLVRLGDNYLPDREIEMAGNGGGWIAIALSQETF